MFHDTSFIKNLELWLFHIHLELVVLGFEVEWKTRHAFYFYTIHSTINTLSFSEFLILYSLSLEDMIHFSLIPTQTLISYHKD
jgi:hypothetical protein